MSQKCLIWGTPAEVQRVPERLAYWVSSLRTGGNYRITEVAPDTIANGVLDEAAKAKLTTALIDRRRDGEAVPRVRSADLEACQEASTLTHAERARRLLRHIAERESASPGRSVSLETDDPTAMAHSESWTIKQLGVLIDHLTQEQLLVSGRRSLHSISCTVTVAGHTRLDADTMRATDQVFVAMWFDSDMNDAYKQGIVPGIRDAGFSPMRIDEKKDANRIDEDIITEIKKSRFIVADMTHGSDGVRGSVYYEAGFAHGLGREVIYSCRKDCVEFLPFDTRQYHHVVWETPEELRRRLTERIRARIKRPVGGPLVR